MHNPPIHLPYRHQHGTLHHSPAIPHRVTIIRTTNIPASIPKRLMDRLRTRNRATPNRVTPNTVTGNQGYPRYGYPQQGYPDQGRPEYAYPQQDHLEEAYPPAYGGSAPVAPHGTAGMMRQPAYFPPAGTGMHAVDKAPSAAAIAESDASRTPFDPSMSMPAPAAGAKELPVNAGVTAQEPLTNDATTAYTSTTVAAVLTQPSMMDTTVRLLPPPDGPYTRMPAATQPAPATGSAQADSSLDRAGNATTEPAMTAGSQSAQPGSVPALLPPPQGPYRTLPAATTTTDPGAAIPAPAAGPAGIYGLP